MSKNKRKNKLENVNNNRFGEYVQFNEKQLKFILNEIKLIHENQNEQINESLKAINDYNLEQNKIKDIFSRIVRWTMFSLFIVVGLMLCIGAISLLPSIWNDDFFNNSAIVILIVLGIILIILGISIIKINDRNYLISVFSSIVALAALIVSIIK